MLFDFQILPEREDDYSVYYFRSEKCKPLHSFGPVIKDHFLIHFIRSGKGRYVVRDKTYFLSRGEAFFIFPGEPGWYEADKDDPWEYFWIGFYKTGLDRLFMNIGISAESPVVSLNSSHVFENHYSRLDETRSSSLENSFRQKAVLLELISDLIKFSGYNSDDNYRNAGKGNDYIKYTYDFIRKNYSVNISVTDIAEYLGLDRSYFSQLFKKRTGESPGEFLKNYRLEKGAELLAGTSFDISAIAESAGYLDRFSFSRSFKKRYGLSPGRYRKTFFNE